MFLSPACLALGMGRPAAGSWITSQDTTGLPSLARNGHWELCRRKAGSHLSLSSCTDRNSQNFSDLSILIWKQSSFFLFSTPSLASFVCYSEDRGHTWRHALDNAQAIIVDLARGQSPQEAWGIMSPTCSVHRHRVDRISGSASSHQALDFIQGLVEKWQVSI